MGWNQQGMIMAAKKKQPRKRAGNHALRARAARREHARAAARAAGFAEGAGAMGDLGKGAATGVPPQESRKPAKQAEHPTDQSIIVGDVFEDVASGIRVRVAGITADTANMAHLNAEGGYTVKCDVLRDPARYRRLTVYKGLVQHFPSNDVNVVTGCRDCPFYASNYYCEHPKSGGDVTPVESGAPPPTCPLRDGPTLVRLKGTP